MLLHGRKRHRDIRILSLHVRKGKDGLGCTVQHLNSSNAVSKPLRGIEAVDIPTKFHARLHASSGHADSENSWWQVYETNWDQLLAGAASSTEATSMLPDSIIKNPLALRILKFELNLLVEYVYFHGLANLAMLALCWKAAFSATDSHLLDKRSSIALALGHLSSNRWAGHAIGSPVESVSAGPIQALSSSDGARTLPPA